MNVLFLILLELILQIGSYFFRQKASDAPSAMPGMSLSAYNSCWGVKICAQIIY